MSSSVTGTVELTSAHFHAASSRARGRSNGFASHLCDASTCYLFSGGKSMLAIKKRLTVSDIESQAIRALPNREMLALVNVTIFDVLTGNTVVLQLPVS